MFQKAPKIQYIYEHVFMFMLVEYTLLKEAFLQVCVWAEVHGL